VNNKLNCTQKIQSIKRADGTLTDESLEQADIFNNFFGSVFTTDDGSDAKIERRAEESCNLSNVSFIPADVFVILKRLKPSTSTGPDGLPNVLLKNCAATLSVPLSHICDTSFKDNCLPASWKLAHVIPIHKKGGTSDPNNFRPISLTSTCCRVMERIINNKLIDFLLECKLITRHQHGFIRKRTTNTNLLECMYDWTINLQSRKVTDVIYFDFKKAFDSVSHLKLLNKLQAYGIVGNLLAWISDFLSNRSQQVKINDILSHPIEVTSGVPQGSVLGPTLFLLFINDVCDIFNNLPVTCKLHADDIKLYSCYDTKASPDELTVAIDKLYQWSVTWQLPIAIDKCFLCRISNTHNSCSHTYHVNGCALPLVDSIRDLGITVDSRLKFDKHIALIVHKAMSRCRLILKCFHSRNASVMLKAYVTYVRPILEYCSSVWSPHCKYLIDKVEKVQRFFTKRLAGLQKMSYCNRLNTLNLQSLESRRLVNDLVLCYKLLHDNFDSSITTTLNLCRNITRGHSYKLSKLLCTIDATKFYFTNRIVNAWNRLPNFVVSSPTVAVFKKRLLDVDFN